MDKKFYLYSFLTIVLILFNNNDQKLTNGEVKPPLGSDCSPLPCRGPGHGTGHGHNIWQLLIETAKLAPMMTVPVAMMGLTNLALVLKLGYISKKGINIRVENDMNRKGKSALTVLIKNDTVHKESNNIGDIKNQYLLDHISKDIGIHLTRKENGYRNDQNSVSSDPYLHRTYGIPIGVGYKPVSFIPAIPIQSSFIGQRQLDWIQTAESKPTIDWSDPDINLIDQKMIPRIPVMRPGKESPSINSNNGYDDHFDYQSNDVEVYNTLDELNQDKNYYKQIIFGDKYY